MERQHERRCFAAEHLLRSHPDRGASTGHQPLQKRRQTALRLLAAPRSSAGVSSGTAHSYCMFQIGLSANKSEIS